MGWKAETKHENAPQGNFLVIKNFQRNGYLTEISNIKIYSWEGTVNGVSTNYADSLKKHDLITDLNGNSITGNIIGMTTNNSLEVKFRAPFTKNESTIPKSSIDVLEFRQTKKIQNLLKQIF